MDHATGEMVYHALQGDIADSAHPMDIQGQGSFGQGPVRDRAYFCFPNLSIHLPGRYRLKLSLMRMNYSDNAFPDGVAIIEQVVNSRSITVEDRGLSFSRPNSAERAFIRILREDGQPLSHSSMEYSII